MILKNKEALKETGERALAGYKQERDAAFFLRREFGNDAAINVINDISFSHDGEKAQIDHLIIHPYGFVIIESKSIFGEITVNAEGEWSRSYRGQWRGMPSPIRQAELQLKLLRDFLGNNVEKFLGKLLGLQTRVGGRDWRILCAVSSAAILHRDEMPKEISSQVVKTEFLGKKVRMLCNPAGGAFFSGKAWFSVQEMADMSTFLLEHHLGEIREDVDGSQKIEVRELNTSASEVVGKNLNQGNDQTDGVSGDLACKKCGETKGLSGQNGRYGYFVRCGSCGTNTPMKMPCAACGTKSVRVSKAGPTYASTCQDCGQSRVVFQQA